MSPHESDMRTQLRLSGITLPEDRIPTMLESYTRWLACAAILNEPLPYTAEPAVAFHPVPGIKP
jgi:hypothetical protein